MIYDYRDSIIYDFNKILIEVENRELVYEVLLQMEGISGVIMSENLCHHFIIFDSNAILLKLFFSDFFINLRKIITGFDIYRK